MNCPNCKTPNYDKALIGGEVIRYCKKCGFTDKPNLIIPNELEEKKSWVTSESKTRNKKI